MWQRRDPRCGVCAPAMHGHNKISRKRQAMAKRAECSIMPGTRELHGPASHWPLPGAALRSARGNADQVVGTNQSSKSYHLATLDAKASPFGGERYAHSSCHKECFHAGRPLFCMLNRIQHTHAACESICTIPTNTQRKLTIAWCHDHVVCRTRSAHADARSGMLLGLFNVQKGQEFILFIVAAP
jgi:hypothetical protein